MRADFHYKVKNVSQLSQLYHANPYTYKKASDLYIGKVLEFHMLQGLQGPSPWDFFLISVSPMNFLKLCCWSWYLMVPFLFHTHNCFSSIFNIWMVKYSVSAALLFNFRLSTFNTLTVIGYSDFFKRYVCWRILPNQNTQRFCVHESWVQEKSWKSSQISFTRMRGNPIWMWSENNR